MAFHVLEQVRKKTRNEWNSLVKEKWTAARIWIQENGEAGFVLGLASGLIMVIMYKLFLALIALAVISGFGVYLIAPEEGEPESEGEGSATTNSNGNGMASHSAENDEAETNEHHDNV